MARRRTSRKADSPGKRPQPRPAPEVGPFELIAWLVALGVVAFRCMIQEGTDYRWQLVPGLGDMATAAGEAGFVPPGPVSTVWLGMAILAVLGLWAVAWLNGGCRRPRRTGLLLPLAGLAAAVVISTLAAADKRAAVTAGADLLATVLLGWTLVQLLRRRWQVRTTVAILLAVGSVQAVKACYQLGVELPATREVFAEHREAFLHGPGADIDPSTLAEFEKRLATTGATGTFAHANAFASLLLLAGVAGAGLAAGKFARIGHPFGWLYASVTAAAAAAVLAAMFATASTGAVAALAAAAVVVLLLWRRGRWLARHLRISALAIGAMIVLAVAGTVLYGRAKGRLPTDNLAIRWEYWSASMRMIAQHGLTGVGAGNFGDRYTQYMAAGAGEQVKDAHNLLIQPAAELGLLGGLATAALFALPMIGAARAARRRCARRSSGMAGSDTEKVSDTRRGAGRCLRLRLPRVSDTFSVSDPFSGAMPEDRLAHRRSPINHAFWPVLIVGMQVALWMGFSGDAPYPHPLLWIWLMGMPLLVVAVCGLMSSDKLAFITAPEEPWLRWGLWAAVTGFLIHGQISLAPSVPAVRTLAICLMAAAVALDRIDEEALATAPPVSLPAWLGWGVLAAGCGLMAVHVGFLVRPVTEANQLMERAVREYRSHPPAADVSAVLPTAGAAGRVLHLADEAAKADPLDPAPHVLAAELFTLTGRWDLADEAWGAALARSPMSASCAYRRAVTALTAYESLRGDARISTDQKFQMRNRALFLARAAEALYPNGRHEHWLLARLLADDGRPAEAAAEFARVLALDDALPPWHAIRKLPPARRREIEQQLHELATRPATDAD